MVARTVGLAAFAVCGLFIDALHWRHMWVVMAMPLALASRRVVRPSRTDARADPNPEHRIESPA